MESQHRAPEKVGSLGAVIPAVQSPGWHPDPGGPSNLSAPAWAPLPLSCSPASGPLIKSNSSRQGRPTPKDRGGPEAAGSQEDRAPSLEVWPPRTLSLQASGASRCGSQSQGLAPAQAPGAGLPAISHGPQFPYLTHPGLPGPRGAPGPWEARDTWMRRRQHPVDPLPAAPLAPSPPGSGAELRRGGAQGPSSLPAAAVPTLAAPASGSFETWKHLLSTHCILYKHHRFKCFLVLQLYESLTDM